MNRNRKFAWYALCAIIAIGFVFKTQWTTPQPEAEVTVDIRQAPIPLQRTAPIPEHMPVTNPAPDAPHSILEPVGSREPVVRIPDIEVSTGEPNMVRTPEGIRGVIRDAPEYYDANSTGPARQLTAAELYIEQHGGAMQTSGDSYCLTTILDDGTVVIHGYNSNNLTQAEIRDLCAGRGMTVTFHPGPFAVATNR